MPAQGGGKTIAEPAQMQLTYSLSARITVILVPETLGF